MMCEGDVGEPLEETLMEKVQRAVWAILCADDAGVVSMVTDGLARKVVIMAACQEFDLTVSESKKIDHAPVVIILR